MKTYRVVEVDVWGNAREGWDINNMFKTDIQFQVKNNASDAEALIAFRKALGHRADARGYHDPYQSEDQLFFCRNSDGKPAYIANRID